MMSAKENFLRAVNFMQPEYVPNYFTSPVTRIAYYGYHPEDIPLDKTTDGTRWRDGLWGVGWNKNLEGVMPFPVYHPLAEENWKDYSWPDPKSLAVPDRLRKDAEKVDREKSLITGMFHATILERCWYLVGMARMISVIFSDPNRAKWLISKIVDFGLEIAEAYIQVGIDIVDLGDDWGTQRGLIMSPETFSKFFKPQYKRLIDFYRGHGVLIRFHSCGRVQDFIDHFLDLKIDILDPIQATANDLNLIRQKTRKNGIAGRRILGHCNACGTGRDCSRSKAKVTPAWETRRVCHRS